MPCRDWPTNCTECTDCGYKDKKIDTLTRLLCGLITEVEDNCITSLSDIKSDVFEKEIKEWWKEHQKLDAARKEDIKRNLKTKLDKLKKQFTPDELEYLKMEIK